MTGAGGLAKLKRLIDSIRVGLLTTVDLDGFLHTLPVETTRCDSDGTLWFFTDHRSPARQASARDWLVYVLAALCVGRFAYLT